MSYGAVGGSAGDAARPSTRLSVIVPTRGPGARLRTMLHSLEVSLAPCGGVEVIVVVDGPGDIAPLLERSTLDVRVLTTGGGRGAAFARNRGAEIARAEVLAFLDDDVIVSVGWGAEVLARVDDPWDLLGGRLASISPDNLVSQMFETLVIRHGCVDGRWYLASADMLVRTTAFRSLGGFDERYPGAGGEDWDLCRRAHRAGLLVRVTDDCLVQHWNPTSIRGLTSRARTYAVSSPLRFAADRPRFGGEEERVVEVASGAAGPRRVASALPVVAAALRRRYAEVREHGFGPARAASILAVHLPWFVAYAVASFIALRRARVRDGGS